MREKIFEPYEGDKPYIFASYYHRDYRVVYRVLSELHKRGYRIWYNDGSYGEEDFEEVVAEKIRNCEVVFVFLSGISEESDISTRERLCAYSQKKKRVRIIIKQDEIHPNPSPFDPVIHRFRLKEPAVINLVNRLCRQYSEIMESCREESVPVEPDKSEK